MTYEDLVFTVLHSSLKLNFKTLAKANYCTIKNFGCKNFGEFGE